MHHKGFLGLLSLIGLAAVVLLGLPPAPAGSQPVAAPAGALIQPTGQVEIPPPRVRTRQEREAAAAAEAAGPLRPPLVKAFRPTMDEAAYRQLKDSAAPRKAPQTPLAPVITGAAPLALTPLTTATSFEGAAQIGSVRPPDTHGAAGPNHFVEVTNSRVDIYQKASGTQVQGLSLAAFFGYATKGLFDPRVIYDSIAGRWIMSADAFAESSTVQKFFFAVSQTADPTGSYFIYTVNVSDGSNGFWDFPQLGMDRNAVIFTANFFQGQTGPLIDTRMFAVAKAQVYNNNGPNPVTLTPHLFTGLTGTLAPPIVLDANPNTYLAAAPVSGSNIALYTLTNSAGNPPIMGGPALIPVSTYIASANAPQPGTNALLDTSDARFVNAGTQIGNSLFQAHSISRNPNNLVGAICRFYEFDAVNKRVVQQGDFSSSGTSFDFNVSIAANRHKDVFVTWSSTDTTVNAEVHVSGRLHTDPVDVITGGAASLLTGGTSSTFYRPDNTTVDQRWGDYSAVSLDPADPSGGTAWVVNEKILTTSSWGSRIGRIKLPVRTPLPFLDLLLGD